MRLSPSHPWRSDVWGAWLVQVSAQGLVRKVSYKTLVPGAPTMCGGNPCGSERPGIVAPAVSADGKTVYTVSAGHFAPDYGFIAAANSTLTAKWQTAITV